nr:outer membrane protein transport protein [Rhizobiaceae bacterium]
YSRGSANLDPLLEEGTYFATTFAYVAPQRGVASYQAAPGAPVIDLSRVPNPGGGTSADTFTEAYTTFSGTAALNLFGDLRCAATYAQPFGADADYGWTRLALIPTLGGTASTTSSSLSSDELGLTCGYGFSAGPGKLHVIGGVFHQTINYDEARAFGYDSTVTGARGADLSLSDDGIGYRLGVAYTMPEIALKASLMYRSEVDHRVEGVVRTDRIPGVGPIIPAYADATLPQSVKLAVQSGIAPGWLAFGSVEWTDWSVLQQVRVFAANGAPLPLTVDAFFKDGWTVNAGIGHKFSDLVSGSFSVTWDSGVSDVFNGATRSAFTDTWTFALGAAITPNENATIRAGLAYSILTAGSETGFNATGGDGNVRNYGTDYSIGGGISASLKF